MSMQFNGWGQPGEGCRTSKLTEDDVREIRRLAGIVTREDLARRYGVSVSTIYSVTSGKHWSHVKEQKR